MKKYIFIVLGALALQTSYADTNQQSVENNQRQAYQEGLRAAEEGERNQQLWAQGTRVIQKWRKRIKRV